MKPRQISINLFGHNLKKAIASRINQFVVDINMRLEKDSKEPKLRSQREWMAEYENWTKQLSLEQLLKDYLED